MECKFLTQPWVQTSGMHQQASPFQTIPSRFKSTILSFFSCSALWLGLPPGNSYSNSRYTSVFAQRRIFKCYNIYPSHNHKNRSLIFDPPLFYFNTCLKSHFSSSEFKSCPSMGKLKCPFLKVLRLMLISTKLLVTFVQYKL